MKRIDWVLIYLTLPLLFLVDWYTKRLALDYSQGQEGPFGPFYLIYNHGAMFGLYSELPNSVKIVFLPTMAAIGMGVYLLFQYLIPGRHLKVRLALSIIMSGILGNVYDRIRYGAIVDFIKFQFGSWISPIFNVADVIQWVGYVILAYAFVRETNLFRPKNYTRKSYLVNEPIQKRFSLLLSTMVLIISGVFAVFGYTFMKVLMYEMALSNNEPAEKLIRYFSFVIVALGVIFSVFAYYLGRIISHRFVGPVFAFERFLKETMNGNHVKFRVRTNSEFKHLEPFADEITARLAPLIPPSSGSQNGEDVGPNTLN